MLTNSKHIDHDCETCNVCVLSVLKELDKSELQELNRAKHFSVTKKNQLLFQDTSPIHGVYFIYSGKVKISKFGIDNQEYILRLSRIGDVIGYHTLLSGNKYSYSAITLEDTATCYVPKEVFTKLIETNANLSKSLLKQFSFELKEAELKLTNLAYKTVRERVAEALLYINSIYGMTENGYTLNASLSRADIAAISGTIEQTVVRHLREFEKEGILKLDKRKINILNLEKLTYLANLE